jgi:hypothetical protein
MGMQMSHMSHEQGVDLHWEEHRLLGSAIFIRVINSVDRKYEDSWRTRKALLQAIPRSIHRNIL